jgi:RimJ/RimL family protein N-acetyltransferase
VPALPSVELADATLRLRGWLPEDAAAVLRALADPQLQRFTLWPAGLSEEDVSERFRAAERRRRAGMRLELAVTRAEQRALVGFVGLEPSWKDSRAEVFYWTAPWARGHGVARGALRLLCRWALDELGLARLELHSDADNLASLKVARAVGFREEGRLRSYRDRAGERPDDVVCGLLPGELITVEPRARPVGRP